MGICPSGCNEFTVVYDADGKRKIIPKVFAYYGYPFIDSDDEPFIGTLESDDEWHDCDDLLTKCEYKIGFEC